MSFSPSAVYSCSWGGEGGESFSCQPGWSSQTLRGRNVILSPDCSHLLSCPHLSPNSSHLTEAALEEKGARSWARAKLAVMEKWGLLLRPGLRCPKGSSAGDTGPSRVNPVRQPFQSRPSGGAGCDSGSAPRHRGAVRLAEAFVCGLARLKAGGSQLPLGHTAHQHALCQENGH